MNGLSLSPWPWLAGYERQAFSLDELERVILAEGQEDSVDYGGRRAAEHGREREDEHESHFPCPFFYSTLEYKKFEEASLE